MQVPEFAHYKHQPFRRGFSFLLRAVVVALLAAWIASVGSSALAQSGDGASAAMTLEEFLVSTAALAEKSVVSLARIVSSASQGELVAGRIDVAHPDFVPQEFATGVLIPSPLPGEPLILTPAHVVRGAHQWGKPTISAESRMLVRFSGGQNAWATVLAADPRSDLAVLVIDSSSYKGDLSELVPLPIAEAERMKKGQILLTAGNPYAIARDGSPSIGWSILSNIGRKPEPDPLPEEVDGNRKPNLHYHGTLWQIDGRLNLGMSGAAVLNLKGEFVGLGSSLAALEGYEKSGGFVVPFNAGIRRVIQSLIQGQEVEYGFLGVQLNPSPVSLRLERPGLPPIAYGTQVNNVFPQSPAGLAGLIQGDVIIGVNGVPVGSADELNREVSQQGPDAVVPVEVLRGGRSQILQVRLGKLPVTWETGIVARKPKHEPWRGTSIDYPTGRMKLLPVPLRFISGVLIAEVQPETPASAANLRAGDYVLKVDRTPVQTPDEFFQAVSRLNGPVSLTLADGRVVTVELQP